MKKSITFQELYSISAPGTLVDSNRNALLPRDGVESKIVSEIRSAGSEIVVEFEDGFIMDPHGSNQF